MTACRAHPRSRGENHRRQHQLGRCGGSSPLTRGKLGRLEFQERTAGLIPAHAGKTAGRGRMRRERWAHPRSRGENRTLTYPYCCMMGSSPLTRGKHSLAKNHGRTPRLIPAHAGKTERRKTRRPSAAAHPRSRGENHGVLFRGWRGWGSSPLTRGKHDGGHRAVQHDGLIPAHAGKT